MIKIAKINAKQTKLSQIQSENDILINLIQQVL